ncbi:MAG: hypothetical protein LLG06_16225 [Desulfobacteraceae bacterium]|nr:hypothetical protein [Desulfobacteraceae bacterium]
MIRWKKSSLRARLYLIAAVILLAGLSGSCAIYLTIGDIQRDPTTDLRINKKYMHDLELYGGKFNVFQDQFRQWFADLWVGKQLALTVLLVSAVLSGGCALAAYHLVSDDGGKPGDGYQ